MEVVEVQVESAQVTGAELVDPTLLLAEPVS